MSPEATDNFERLKIPEYINSVKAGSGVYSILAATTGFYALTKFANSEAAGVFPMTASLISAFYAEALCQINSKYCGASPAIDMMSGRGFPRMSTR